MNRTYSNIKKIALSLLVVGLAISTQAFMSTEKSKEIKFKRTDGTFLAGSIVQTVANNTFVQSTSPESDDCNNATTSYRCIYTVTPTGATNIPDQPSYSSDEIDDYLAASPAWLVSGGSSTGVYTGTP